MGVTVTLIVATAGMVSTTWVQFIKGSMLVGFCAVVVLMILERGFKTTDFETLKGPTVADSATMEKPWANKPYVKSADGAVWRVTDKGLIATQVFAKRGGQKFVNGQPQSKANDLQPPNWSPTP